ncbi:ATP-grasp domain-containing protein [Streptomyces sp. NPDC001858]
MTHLMLLLVESNTTGTGRQFVQRARSLGIEPVLLTADASRYPYVAQDGVRTEVVDTADDSAVLGVARRLLKDGSVAGVTSSSEYYVATAAATACALGLPGPDAAAVRDCRDKARQRRLLRAGQVAVPEHKLVHSVEEALAAAESIGYPVVLKPVQGSGSSGVRLCEGADATAAQAAALATATVNERGVRVPSGFLVEEYVRGAEYSVEVFGHRVVAVIAKRLGPLPDFVELGHDLPAELSPADASRLQEQAVRAVEALGLGWGAAHVELRMDHEDVRVIEVNPRLAGGMIPELIRHAMDVDLVGGQVRAAVGLDPGIESTKATRSAAIRFLTVDRRGRLGDQARTERALATALDTPNVESATLYRAPHEPVEPARDFRGRLGHVIAAAEDAAVVGRSATAALHALAAAIRPTTGRSPS